MLKRTLNIAKFKKFLLRLHCKGQALFLWGFQVFLFLGFICLCDVMLLQEVEAWTISSHRGGSAGRTVLAA
uniref:Uncharacterized protein n=1 Tax=Arundo donax TaxID=35708 RepID=A0A0A9DJ04_ARUDO